MEPLTDRFGRRIEYLRVSVTDRCNMRCRYCMPAEGISFRPREEVLRYEEILRITGKMAELGVRRFRITGGEPLIRRDLLSLVAGIARLPDLEDLALTTNGVLLADCAAELKEAGLKRVNISLDSLRPEVFARITRLGEWKRVWRGIWTALEMGLTPVKLNVVLLKGLNASEVPDFARLTLSYPLHVRFIELMPRGGGGIDHAGEFLSAGEARALCGQAGPLEPAPDTAGVGPAESFRIAGAKGTVGFIGALTCNFCRQCNRMRLGSDGTLRPCLDNSAGVPLREALRAGASDEEMERLIREAVRMKPEGHTMQIGAGKMQWEPMCAVGG